ncbi:MAG: metallophosphoesterase [Planctomycetota bacterium]
MRLFVIGDVHVAAERVAARDLLGRRVVGVLNHRWRRRGRFDLSLLPGMAERMAAEARGGDGACGLVCTGDVTTTGLAAEFDAARAALEPARAAVVERGGEVWVVPGNHDAYTFAAARSGRVAERMAGWRAGPWPMAAEVCDGWRMLLLDSSKPNVVSSRGRLGAGQVAALREALDATGEGEGEGLVVVCHYPPVVPGGVEGEWPDFERWGRRLAEGREVWEMMRRCRGRVVWLHGHVHEPWWWAAGEAAAVRPGGRGDATAAMSAEGRGVVMINAGSPCVVDRRWPFGQGYWTVTLGMGPSGVRVSAEHRAGVASS